MNIKRIITGIKKMILKPDFRFLRLSERGFYNSMPDEKYLKKLYKANMGRELNLENPKRYTEKLQWLKLHDRRPEYTIMVDKYEVKKYVSEKIGEEYIIPTIGVWDSPDEINFDDLPDKFVIKCNHNSGTGMAICKDKSTLDIEKVKSELTRGLKQDYYLKGREWPYKDVKRRIIAEKYMEDEKTAELRDYKFFCFNGEAKMLFIASDRQTKGEETKFDFFDMDYNLLPFTNGHPNAKVQPEKPVCFDEMRALAEKLSAGIPHLRVDFYEVNGKVYFGELTFSHWSGMMPFEPDEWDEKIGEWLVLK